MKILPRLCLYLCLVFWCTGCARQADVGSAVRFTEGALVFDYPGNWKITSNEPLGVGRLVILEAPGSVLMTITAYPAGMDVSLKDYGENLKANMTGSTLGLMMHMKSQDLHQAGESLELKFTVSVAGIHVPHTQDVTRHVFGEVTVFCMSQVADEDRHLMQAGFELVRKTLSVSNPKEAIR